MKWFKTQLYTLVGSENNITLAQGGKSWHYTGAFLTLSLSGAITVYCPYCLCNAIQPSCETFQAKHANLHDVKVCCTVRIQKFYFTCQLKSASVRILFSFNSSQNSQVKFTADDSLLASSSTTEYFKVNKNECRLLKECVWWSETRF